MLQGVQLNHNMSGRIIHSNQSLVLQKVTRQSAGQYKCSVVNSEGETVSNELNFRVQCKFELVKFNVCYYLLFNKVGMLLRDAKYSI